ncbi:transposase [Pseudopedobacter saltans]|nr:transposase [Pseudopedobacter saltans]
MGLIAKKCFPNAVQVIDRFHVQQLATEAGSVSKSLD